MQYNKENFEIYEQTKNKCNIIRKTLKFMNKQKWKGRQSGTYLRHLISNVGSTGKLVKTYRDETKKIEYVKLSNRHCSSSAVE